ncbi:hypothetical protein BTHI11S_05390 [Bosea thiooxidans]
MPSALRKSAVKWPRVRKKLSFFLSTLRKRRVPSGRASLRFSFFWMPMPITTIGMFSRSNTKDSVVAA